MSERWYPVSSDLKDAKGIEHSFRQLLTQHYELQDKFDTMQKQQAQAPAQGGNGPIDTKLLGLNVTPIDTQQLANGATLKWNKLKGAFEVS
jgi:hypothetical protein